MTVSRGHCSGLPSSKAGITAHLFENLRNQPVNWRLALRFRQNMAKTEVEIYNGTKISQ
jgi:hypothetical protein